MNFAAHSENSPVQIGSEQKPLSVSTVRPMGSVSEAEAKPTQLPPSQNFQFKAQRKAHGYCALFSAVGFGIVTVVLLSQAYFTKSVHPDAFRPDVASAMKSYAHLNFGGVQNMLLLGTLGFIATIGFLVVAYRDFCGKLIVDQNGIQSSPFLFGFKIRWDELKNYEWKSAAIKGLDGNQLWLWKADSSPIVFEAGWISPRDRQALREWLGRKNTLSA